MASLPGRCARGWQQKAWCCRSPSGRRGTGTDGWHVTLKFLGATWPRLMDDVGGAIRSVAETTEAFETSLTQVGVFPSPRRARVVWAGLADPGGRFGAIVERLDDLLAEHF